MLQTLVAFVTLGVLQHLLEHHHILKAVSHPGICRQAVATGPTGLLVIGFQGLGQVEVSNEPHVGLVDTHAEGNGRDHDQPFLVEETPLVVRPGFRRQPGVIRQGRKALLAEQRGNFIDLLARQAVDDPRVGTALRQERQQLLAWLLLGNDAVEDVRPIETGEKPFSILQVQAIDDFFAPLRNAMRLVDGEQGNIEVLQERQHARLNQALGRQVEHFHFATANARRQLALLLGAQRRVHSAAAATPSSSSVAT